uniref:G-protein coupled receptors family 1 profile domain-containing protein n=1 Tax=Eptatretus burgeri TaxID=7764 RepID=A0A8C4Q2U2_EPTBU
MAGINNSHMGLSCKLDNASPWPSAFMFAIGVVGNGLALTLLAMAPPRQRSAFLTLVCSLAVTDLVSTLMSSPVVLASHATGKSLMDMGGQALCNYFVICMLFFGLATMGILCAMAAERCLSLCQPYTFARRFNSAIARRVLLVLYVLSMVAAALPLFGVGSPRMYKPCTWCYVEMRRSPAYSLTYAGITATLAIATLIMNAAAAVALFRMHHAAPPQGHMVIMPATSTLAGPSPAASLLWKHISFRQRLLVHRPRPIEIEHLLLLAIMTLVFLVCSVPLMITAFIDAADPENKDYRRDLQGLRFASFNPILDPWIFIIFRRAMLCRVAALPCLQPFCRRRQCEVTLKKRNGRTKGWNERISLTTSLSSLQVTVPEQSCDLSFEANCQEQTILGQVESRSETNGSISTVPSTSQSQT